MAWSTTAARIRRPLRNNCRWIAACVAPARKKFGLAHSRDANTHVEALRRWFVAVALAIGCGSPSEATAARCDRRGCVTRRPASSEIAPRWLLACALRLHERAGHRSGADDFIEYRAHGIMLLGVLERLSSQRDSARSKVDKSPIEVRQCDERWPRLIEIGGLIKPAAPGENLLGDRVELAVGRLFRPRREDVDARR